MGPDEFALRSADALARTLNLRRTLHRLTELAASRFGPNAIAAVVVDGEVRSATHGDWRADISADTSADLTADTVRRLAATGPKQVSATASVLAGVTFPSDCAAVSLVPLRDPITGTDGVLAVAGPGPADLDELTALAARGSAAVAAACVYEERAALAERLRAALLPAPLPTVAGLQLGASYRPARVAQQLGGDFYDVFPADDSSWSITIGDVAGKGVDAAILTGQVRQSIRTGSRVTADPAEVLRLVNDTLLTGDGSTFVTVLQMTVRPTPDGASLRVAAGGHPPPLLLRGDRVTALGTRGTIVGMLEDVEFTAVDADLAPGDTVLMFTDGVLEAPGPDGLLGVRPVADLLADCEHLTAQAITERVLQLVIEHVPNPDELDDIAVVAVRAAPGNTAPRSGA